MAKGDGVKWQDVKTAAFTGEIKKLHTTYMTDIEKANEAATKLRDAIKREWTSKHPDGQDVDGQTKVIAIKVVNGSIQFAMVNAAKDETGVDIFAKV